MLCFGFLGAQRFFFLVFEKENFTFPDKLSFRESKFFLNASFLFFLFRIESMNVTTFFRTYS